MSASLACTGRPCALARLATSVCAPDKPLMLLAVAAAFFLLVWAGPLAVGRVALGVCVGEAPPRSPTPGVGCAFVAQWAAAGVAGLGTGRIVGLGLGLAPVPMPAPFGRNRSACAASFSATKLANVPSGKLSGLPKGTVLYIMLALQSFWGCSRGPSGPSALVCTFSLAPAASAAAATAAPASPTIASGTCKQGRTLAAFITHEPAFARPQPSGGSCTGAPHHLSPTFRLRMFWKLQQAQELLHKTAPQALPK